jgi:hypothetical protein
MFVTLHHYISFQIQLQLTRASARKIMVTFWSLVCLLKNYISEYFLKCFHEDGKQCQCASMCIVLRLRNGRSLAMPPLLHHGRHNVTHRMSVEILGIQTSKRW